MNEIDQDKKVSKEFDRQAKGYDKSFTVNNYQRKAQIAVIKQLKFTDGMTILDLGCGTGSGTIDIAKNLNGTGKVVGIDVSENMIDQAKKKIDIVKNLNIEFHVGSGHSLKYDNVFDYVISTNAYHHFKNKKRVFANVYDSLKDNGIFIIQDICNDFFMMNLVDIAGKLGEKAHVGSTTANKLNEIFKSTSFSKIKIEKFRLNWFWKIMIGQGIKHAA